MEFKKSRLDKDLVRFVFGRCIWARKLVCSWHGEAQGILLLFHWRLFLRLGRCLELPLWKSA